MFRTVHWAAASMAVGFLVAAAGCSKPEESVSPTPTSTQASPAPQPAADTPKTPAEVARAFMEAGNAADKEAMQHLLTEAAWTGLNSGDSSFNMEPDQFTDFTVGEATITGEEAEVPVDAVQNGEDVSMDITLRQQEGAWRVYGIVAHFGEGFAMTVDFEKLHETVEAMAKGIGEALAEGMQQSFEQAMTNDSAKELTRNKLLFEALAPVDVDAFESSWQVAESYEGTPAAEVLSSLAAAIDLAFAPGEFEETLTAPVGDSLKGLSYLEAVEQVCAEQGLHPVYPDLHGNAGALWASMGEALAQGMTALLDSEDSAIQLVGDKEQARFPEKEESDARPQIPAITVENGPRPYPVTFAGPFLAEVLEVKENAPYPTGLIRVGIRAYGLHPSVLALAAEAAEPMVIRHVVNTQGQSLRKNDDIRYIGGGSVHGTAYTDSVNIELRNLFRDVTAIKSVSAVQRLSVPLDVHLVKFDRLAENAQTSAGPLTVTVKKHGGNTTFEVRSDEISIEEIAGRFWAMDEHDEGLEIAFSNISRRPDRVQISLNMEQPPHAVYLKLVTVQKELEFPFELTEISLKRHAEMPEELEELNFEGHDAPVTLEFVEFKDRDSEMPNAVLKAENHSNKDIMSIKATLEYLDAGGQKLNDYASCCTLLAA